MLTGEAAKGVTVCAGTHSGKDDKQLETICYVR